MINSDDDNIIVDMKTRFRFNISGKDFTDIIKAVKKTGNKALVERLYGARSKAVKEKFEFYISAGILAEDDFYE